MNKASDVIVIGAGVVGCAAAYYLAKRGVKVTVLERREVACGASRAAIASEPDSPDVTTVSFLWPCLG